MSETRTSADCPNMTRGDFTQSHLRRSNQNCRRYKVDTGCGTDGWTDEVKPIYGTLQQLRCAVGMIIATLHWASCGPGTGLQAYLLKSQYRFGKKMFAGKLHKSYKKNIHTKLHLPLLDTLHCKQNQKINWNNSISMVLWLWARFSNSLHLPYKANLRDLIAATGLVILLKLDSNLWFFILCDLEILMDDLEKL